MFSQLSNREYNPVDVPFCYCDEVTIHSTSQDDINFDLFPISQQFQAPSIGLSRVILSCSQNLLQILNLSQNNISDLSFISSLPSLIQIDFSRNSIESESLHFFQSLAYLDAVDLSHNKLTQLELENFANVKKVALSNNAITEIKRVPFYSNLNYLDLSNNKLTEIKAINFLDSLQFLDISNNRIQRIKYVEFLKHKNVTILSFKGNPFFVGTEYFHLIYMCMFLNCTDLNGIPISSKVRWGAISTLNFKLTKKKNLEFSYSFHTNFKYERIVILHNVGVSYAIKLTKDAPMSFSIEKVHGKIQLCPHQTVSFFDDTTLVVHDLDANLEFEHQLVIQLSHDEYDYCRFRTQLMEYIYSK
eukprot:NODE_27_length_39007_cov_1.590650.p13 type:complete len:359 gc:universal NODE_27_length_39007_cov_1.590650:14152-13076(-)